MSGCGDDERAAPPRRPRGATPAPKRRTMGRSSRPPAAGCPGRRVTGWKVRSRCEVAMWSISNGRQRNPGRIPEPCTAHRRRSAPTACPIARCYHRTDWALCGWSPRGAARRRRVSRGTVGPTVKVAERVGFEPTVPCDTPHFECGAIDHSATSPCASAGSWGSLRKNESRKFRSSAIRRGRGAGCVDRGAGRIAGGRSSPSLRPGGGPRRGVDGSPLATGARGPRAGAGASRCACR